MNSFDTALALSDIRRASDADVPVDDSGFVHSDLIPEDRVEADCICPSVTFDGVDNVWRCDECDLPIAQHAERVR